MPQLAWTVLTQNGQRYQLGLYHGDTSGHVLIHANGKVLLTDLSVLESRTYTFFLEDDLCEVSIVRQGSGFTYGCELNREANTDLNRARKKVEKQHWRQTLAWTLGIFAAIILVTLVVTRNPSEERREEEMERLRMRSGRETSVVLTLDASSKQWNYRFKSYLRWQQGQLDWPLDTITTAGWPIESGDEFRLYHSPDFAQLFFVDLAQPGQRPLQRYRRLSEERHYALHPEYRLDLIKCQVKVVEEWMGARGLRLLYDQTIRGKAYQELVRSANFEAAVEECTP